MASPFCKRFVRNHMIAGFIEHGCEDDSALSMYPLTIWWHRFLSDMQTHPILYTFQLIIFDFLIYKFTFNVF